MKAKTTELEGIALNWSVAKAIGENPTLQPGFGSHSGARMYPWIKGSARPWEPSTMWHQGGPLVDKYCSALNKTDDGIWWAHSGNHLGEGSTPLIAAMRAIVATKFGDEVEVPDELLA